MLYVASARYKEKRALYDKAINEKKDTSDVRKVSFNVIRNNFRNDLLIYCCNIKMSYKYFFLTA